MGSGPLLLYQFCLMVHLPSPTPATPHPPSIPLNSAEGPRFSSESLHFHVLLPASLPSRLKPGSLSSFTPVRNTPGSPLTSQASLCPFHLADSVVLLSVSQLIDTGDLSAFWAVSPFVALCLAPGRCLIHTC